MLTFSVFSQKTAYQMLVGTFTKGKSEGIYNLSFNKKGKLISQTLAAKTDNPSYMAFSPDKKFLYAVNETKDNSGVTAYSFDTEKKSLKFINRINLGNSGPCYVTSTQHHVIVGNYGNGTISVLARNSDGSLTDTIQTIVHVGKMFGRGRFGTSNVHQTLFSPDGNYLIVNNLGKDCVYSYAYNPQEKKEILTEVDVKIMEKHSGPRHATFSKNGKYLYLLQELNAGLKVFTVSEKGKLDTIQQLSIRKSEFENSASDIHLSPDEKFLYAANRGTVNEIVCFKMENNGEKIVETSSISSGGKIPRNFALSPDGKYIFVGNQKSDNITVFSRNKNNGKLSMLKNRVDLAAPVCLLFF